MNSGVNLSSLSASEIASAIERLEEAIELDHRDWSMGDLHLWPLYRMELYRLMFIQGATAAPSGARPSLGPALKPTHATSPSAKKACRVWLVSDGISFTTLDGKAYERFCGPLYDACLTAGVDAVVVDRASDAPRDCAEPTRWWAPMTQRAKLHAGLCALIAPDGRHARLVKELERKAAALAIQLPPLSARRLDAMARAVRLLATSLARRMRREAVRAVFLVGYYDVAGYAYVLAAARAGCRSIDLQHGLTGPLHMGYARWQRAPRSGLALLPQCFWCWTDDDAEVVRAWLPLQHEAREVVVGGHPFLQKWREGGIPLSESTASDLIRLQRKSPSRPRVLVTLQPNVVSEEMLAPLLDAWRQGVKATWWLRLHPMGTADRPAIEAMLRKHRVAHWDIDIVTSLPLPAVLAAADLHLTHSSSAVVEAELMGVHSVMWSAYGAELVPEAIRRGAVSVALDGPSLVRAVQKGLGPRQSAPGAPRPSAITDALLGLLGSKP